MKRRIFLGAGLLAAIGWGVAARLRAGKELRPLATDPEAQDFVYRDGWIEDV